LGALASFRGFPELVLKPPSGLWAKAGFTSGLGAGYRGLWGAVYRRLNSYSYVDEYGREGVVVNSWRFGSAGGFQLPIGELTLFGYAQGVKGGSPGPLWAPTPQALLADTQGFFGARAFGFQAFIQGGATRYETPGLSSRSSWVRAALSGDWLELAFERTLGRGRVSWKVEKNFGSFAVGVKDLFPVGRLCFGFWKFKARLELDLHEPTFGDLYWPPDQFAEGNQSLRPEKVLLAQVWVEEPRVWASCRILWDYIAWVPGERWHPENLNPVLAPELGLRTKWGGFSWTPTRWQGERLPYLADWHAWLRPSFKGFYLFGDYTGPRAAGVGGRLLGGFWLWEAGWEGRLWRLDLKLSLKNLLDENPEIVPGYPLPGRRLEVFLCAKP